MAEIASAGNTPPMTHLGHTRRCLTEPSALWVGIPTRFLRGRSTSLLLPNIPKNRAKFPSRSPIFRDPPRSGRVFPVLPAADYRACDERVTRSPAGSSRCSRSRSRATSRSRLPSRSAFAPTMNVTCVTCACTVSRGGSSSAGGHDRMLCAWSRAHAEQMLDLFSRRPPPPTPWELNDPRHVGKGDDAATVVADGSLTCSADRTAGYGSRAISPEWPSRHN